MNLIIQAPVYFTMPSIEAAGYPFMHWHEGWKGHKVIDWDKFLAGIARAPVGGNFAISLEDFWTLALAEPVLALGMADMLDRLVNHVLDLKDLRIGIYNLPAAGHDINACFKATRQCAYIMPLLYNFTDEGFAEVERAQSIRRRGQKVVPDVSFRALGGDQKPEAGDMDWWVKNIQRCADVGVDTVRVWDEPNHVKVLNPDMTTGDALVQYERELLAYANAARGIG